MTALRWAGPVVLAVLLGLVLTRRLSLGQAAVVFVAVEAVLALAALAQGIAPVRSYCTARGGGADREAAFEAAARAVLPGPIAVVVLHEAQLIHSLLLWGRGRQHGVPPGAVAIPYGRDGRAVGIALLTVSLVELVVIELVIPWPTVRLVLLLLGVYAVVIVLGLIAKSVVRTHVLTADSLQLRVSTWADITLPLDSITSVSRRWGNADGFVAFTASPWSWQWATRPSFNSTSTDHGSFAWVSAQVPPNRSVSASTIQLLPPALSPPPYTLVDRERSQASETTSVPQATSETGSAPDDL